MKPRKVTTGPLKVKSAIIICALALVAGIAFDRLVRPAYPHGLGLVAFAAIVATSVVCVRRPRRAESVALLVGALLTAAWVGVRAAEFLAAINILAALGLVAIAIAADGYDVRIWSWRVRDCVRGWFAQARSAVLGPRLPIAAMARARGSVKIGPAVPYLRGFLIAAPVFVVFAMLLSSADAVFGKFMAGAVPSFDLTLGAWAEHAFWIGSVGWVAAGLLVFIASPDPLRAPKHQEAPESPSPDRLAAVPRRIGFVEVMVVLVSVSLLFALFVGFQFTYLFGGTAQVELPGVTYAEYARAGFFQLLAVAMLTVALIWIALRGEGAGLREGRRAAFRAVCAAMVALTLVILASALKRLSLYEQAYGFTQMRLLSHMFTWMIAGGLVLLMSEVLVPERRTFLAGTVVIGFVALMVLNAINPDAYIARHNLERKATRERIEGSEGRGRYLGYLSQLGPDAVPEVLDDYERSPRDRVYRRQMAGWLCWYIEPREGWREWSLGWQRAKTAIADAGFGPRSRDCKGYTW